MFFSLNFTEKEKYCKYSGQRTHNKLCSVSWVFVVKKNNSEIQERDPIGNAD
mgnify:CR=1 FL=1